VMRARRFGETLNRGYLFVLVLAVRLSRWRGRARILSGVMSVSFVEFLILLTVAMWAQITLDRQVSSSRFLLALMPVALYFLNLRVTRSRKFEALEGVYNLLPRWQRLTSLTLFVLAAILILLFSVRYLGIYQRHFRIGYYERTL